LSVDSAGSDYTIAVAAGGLSGATSASFNVNAGRAVKLGFITQPSNTVAFGRITPAVRVALTDSLGNRSDGSGTQIVVALQPSPNLLTGDKSKNTAGGVATFSDLRVTRTGSGFVLVASAENFANVTSDAFSINEPTDVIGLAIRVQPSDASSGRPITPAIRVAAVNSLGNTVTTSNASISLALVVGSGTSGATMHG